MLPTTPFELGDVVLVPFPFTDQSGSKKRPAVVVSCQEYNGARPDILIAAVSSRLREPLGHAELLVAGWREAGLLAPSVVKPVLATIESGLVLRRLGRLSAAERGSLGSFLRRIFGAGI